MKNLFFYWLILSIFSVFSLHAQIFVNDARPDDTGDGLSLATAKKTIAAGIFVATDGQTVNIAPGSYIIGATIVINKKVRLLGIINPAVPFNPLAALTMVGSANTILQVASTDVTIENLYLRLDGTSATLVDSKHGIFVSNHGINTSYNNLVIKGNWIENTAPNTPSPVNFEAYGIRLSDVGQNQGAGNNNITIENNLIFSANNTRAVFGRAIRSIGNFGIIRNNTLTAFYGVQTARLLGGNLVVSNNTFNGIGDTGIEINIPFQDGGVHDIDNNTFNSVAGANPVSMIEIKDNGNVAGVASSIRIRGNTFSNFPNFGVFVGHSKNVTISNNTFTPFPTSTNFIDIFVNTKHRSIDTHPAVTVENIVIQGNTMNGTTTPAGFGILFANHYSGASPAFSNITIGGTGAGQANTFAQNLGTFISLDPQSSGSLAVVPNTLWANNTPTTTAAVSANFDVINNSYNVGSGNQLANTMSKANLMLVENKISHGVDYGVLGFVRVRAKSVFVTPASFLPGFTSVARIKRGTDLISADDDTLNVSTGTYTQDALSPTTSLNTYFVAVGGSVISPGWTMNGAGKTLNLLTDLTISDKITFTDGNIETNANTLIFTPAATDPAANPTLDGEKNNSYIIGRAQTIRTVGTGAFDFLGLSMPTGNDLGTLDLVRTSGPAGITTAGSNTSIAAKWSINPSVPNGRNNVIFRWLPAINNNKLPGSLSAWRFDNGPLWGKESPDFVAAFTTPLFVSVPLNLLQLKDWTISDQPNPLPLNWLSLKAQINQNGSSEILWTTIEEKNTSHFIIERSKDGRTFEQIGQTQAANTSRANDYRFEDASFKNSAIQNVYYRIRQVDQNQAFTYSGVVKLIQNGDSKLVFDLYPNPNKSSFSISLADGFADSQTTIKVYDTQARLVLQKSYDSQNSEIRFDHNLPAGVYMIICQNNKSRQTKRMIVK